MLHLRVPWRHGPFRGFAAGSLFSSIERRSKTRGVYVTDDLKQHPCVRIEREISRRTILTLICWLIGWMRSMVRLE